MTIANLLSAPVTTLCACLKIVRPDGLAVALTTHDQEIPINGMWFRPSSSFTLPDVRLLDGISVSDLQVTAPAGPGMSAADARAGKLNGGLASLFMLDWDCQEGGTLDVFEGEIVATSVDGGGVLTISCRSFTARLSHPAALTCSPTCRAEFGDRSCRVDLAGKSADVSVGEGSSLFEIVLASAAPNNIQFGRARVLTGIAAGAEARIVDVRSNTVVLGARLAALPGSGDRVRLWEGCDRTLATCATRFANARNFRAEPHVPGSDALLWNGA